jgi:hypothetical protein
MTQQAAKTTSVARTTRPSRGYLEPLPTGYIFKDQKRLYNPMETAFIYTFWTVTKRGVLDTFGLFRGLLHVFLYKR